MKPRQIMILLIGLSLCTVWTVLTWPGSRSHGHFYAYPVTLPLLQFWATGWTVVLIPTIFIVIRTRKNSGVDSNRALPRTGPTSKIIFCTETIVDLEEFERLKDFAVTAYSAKTKHAKVDGSFLEYFIQRKGQWDDVHLEIALFWLGKIESLAAYQEIAGFLEHRSKTVQFIAEGYLVEMKPEVDAEIMARVVTALEHQSDPATKQSLLSVVGKPASEEARSIADQYFARQKNR